ncbi:Tripartite motif-containing 35 [Gossypium arboreum]|uniref:Tripartite motif-containing 35 n=1 Tax=Gossypium arboreum TaxID=29729 RepID=A0A0B0MEC3_GOSAR|nr:Tripartite motif-containing 35 [Gossypium arboreum]
MALVRQGSRVRPCQDMASTLIKDSMISCKTMPRHGINKFYKVRKSYKTMSRHGIDELL